MKSKADIKESIESILFNGWITKKDQLEKLAELLHANQKEEKPTVKHAPGFFNPAPAQIYYHLTDVKGNQFQVTTDYARKLGVCCETEAEGEFVEAHKTAKLELIDRIAELNDGCLDWDDGNQEKWFFTYEYGFNAINYSMTYKTRVYQSWFYAKSRDILVQIYEEFGDEKLKLALWPEYKG